MLAIVVAEAVAIALLGVLVLGLLRSHALILRALHELGAGLELEKETAPAGQPTREGVEVELERGVVANARPATSRASDIVGTTLSGQTRTIGVRAPGQRTLLAFLTSGCSVCQTFWDEFASGTASIPGDGALAVIAKGPEEESVTTLRRLAGDRLEVVQSSAGWTDYDIPGSPYFIYVEDGVITGEGSSTSWPQVRDLMAQAVDDTAEARKAAGRSGPGPVGIDIGRGERDSLPRMDQELLGAGIAPGHASLYEPPDATHEIVPDHAGHDHDHSGHDHEPGHDHDHGDHEHGHTHDHHDHHDVVPGQPRA